MPFNFVTQLMLSASGWVAVTIVGALIWAFGGTINNHNVIQAGQVTVAIGVIVTLILAIVFKKFR